MRPAAVSYRAARAAARKRFLGSPRGVFRARIPRMRKFTASLSIGALAAALSQACSSDSTSGTAQPLADAGHGGHAHADASHDGHANPGQEGGVDPFNGDCDSARWAPVSDACWSCACSTCKEKLNACNNDCMDVLFCSFDRHTLVNDSKDIGCEIRATLTECLNNPTAQAVAQPLTQFDSCLIGAPKPSGGFRACEKECGIPYSGDVCTRYPEPPPAHSG